MTDAELISYFRDSMQNNYITQPNGIARRVMWELSCKPKDITRLFDLAEIGAKVKAE